ncbi:uncharacterized protein TNIN_176191 [Trichonephila inaurata madagascariensis]|uniref:Uncharacterized protein n=1 Tax=Trichonephila inaurata madagascariensis TaxID=2747483 RepID=A0A8X6YUP6_9ARAC|nr:uncharacterized protein TNIN_176191 [Trichonephila inaurata madagascariensis]
MECDSMNSVIERALRHKKINVPADYAYLAKEACKKNPYEVEYLYHHFFKDFQTTLPFYKSIKPGKRVCDPTVTNIRALRHVPDGKIVYKLRHTLCGESSQSKRKKYAPFYGITFLNYILQD